MYPPLHFRNPDKIRLRTQADYIAPPGFYMAFASVWAWLTRKPRQRPDLRFLLYTRANCPLCDEAWDLLTDFQSRYGFTLDSQDVDHSANLACEFGNCVPVVTVNGKVRFRGHINKVLLTRLLDA
jgi:glutaredoxin